MEEPPLIVREPPSRPARRVRAHAARGDSRLIIRIFLLLITLVWAGLCLLAWAGVFLKTGGLNRLDLMGSLVDVGFITIPYAAVAVTLLAAHFCWNNEHRNQNANPGA